MQRKKALRLLKDVTDKCPLLNGSIISLMPPLSGLTISKGYQIHIKNPVLDEQTIKFLDMVLDEYHVAKKYEDGILVLYQQLSN